MLDQIRVVQPQLESISSPGVSYGTANCLKLSSCWPLKKGETTHNLSQKTLVESSGINTHLELGGTEAQNPKWGPERLGKFLDYKQSI